MPRMPIALIAPVRMLAAARRPSETTAQGPPAIVPLPASITATHVQRLRLLDVNFRPLDK